MPDEQICERCEAILESAEELRTHTREQCRYTCEQCDQSGDGMNWLDTHNLRYCPEQVLSDQTSEDVVEAAAVLQPAAILEPEVPVVSWRVKNPGPATLPQSARDPEGSSRDPANRVYSPTHAWYGYVPDEVDIEGLSVTGLPVDILGSVGAWQTHQVQSQIEQGKIILTPVERYGMRLRGSPYVHIRRPDPDVWAEFVSRWEAILPQEIEIESGLLEDAEHDLERAVTREERAMARRSIQVFSTRVPQLQTLDFKRIFGFLVKEHEFSLHVGRSDTQIMREEVGDVVDERMEAMFEEHVG